MLDVQQGKYFGLDGIGSDIWARMEAPLQVRDLCGQLVAAYAVDEKTCQRDVIALLEQLRDSGLIEVHHES
jgi:hypothetical protein